VVDEGNKGSVPDSEIVKGIRAGSEESQKLLWDKYWRALMAVALHTGLSKEDAEEVVSDVFFRILQLIEAGRTGDNVGPLLRSSTRNAAISHYRGERQRREHETERLDPDALVPTGSYTPELEESVVPYKKLLVQQALEKLSPTDRSVAEWIGHGATNEELAAWTGSNINNARQLRFRTLRRLQEEITAIIEGLPEQDRRSALEKMFRKK
jgi:RNA polymerase sigma factor (sigma-70 family)